MMNDPYLGDAGTKGEFFLKLVSRVDKGEYVVNKLVDRRGREAMFYRYKGVDFDIVLLCTCTNGIHICTLSI